MPDREAVTKEATSTTVDQAAAAHEAETASKTKQIHDQVTALEKLVADVVPSGPYCESGLQLLRKAHRVFNQQIFSTGRPTKS